MQEQFKNLKKEIAMSYPNNKLELTLFPSGAAMFQVQIGEETYSLEYHLDVGVGISKVSTATFGWEGYDYPFESFEEARTFIFDLLKNQ